MSFKDLNCVCQAPELSAWNKTLTEKQLQQDFITKQRRTVMKNSWETNVVETFLDSKSSI